MGRRRAIPFREQPTLNPSQEAGLLRSTFQKRAKRSRSTLRVECPAHRSAANRDAERPRAAFHAERGTETTALLPRGELAVIGIESAA